MDWNAAIEKNREALKRVLAMLVAMAGIGGAAFTSPLRGGRWSPDHRVGVIGGTQPPPDASRRPPLKGEVNPEFTLPRHLHRAVLRLLRPAEAAARRLVIVMARGLMVPPARPRKPEPPRKAGGAGMPVPRGNPAPRALPLPLLDPLPRWSSRVRPVARGVPRISVPGFSEPFPVAAPPSPDDPVNAARLALRLEALASALDDLPGAARRFARWRARGADAAGSQNKSRDAAGAQNKEARDVAGAQDKSRDAAGAQDKKTRDVGRVRRLWPLRPGRPPGWRRRPSHEVHEVLDVVHGLAFWALESPDTS